MEPTLGKFEMERFDGKGDFGMWKYKMLGQLEIQGLLSVLQEEGSVQPPLKDGDEAQEVKIDPKRAEKDLRFRSLLGTCLSDTILPKIMHQKTALVMWQELERDYQTKSLPNRIYLKQMFASYKMEESKTIEENLDMFLKLITDLASLNINISDEDQAIQVLSGLPPQYEALVYTLKYEMGKDTITLQEVTTSAYAKEVELKQKRLFSRTKANGEGLYVENRGRTDRRTERSNSGSNHSYSSNRGSRSKSKDSRSKACWVCGSDSHWKRDCPERKKGGFSSKPQGSANVTASTSTFIALTSSLIASGDQWVMDSGCTFHITPRKELLSEFVEFEGSKVLMGNDTFCVVKGIGKITIDSPDGSVVVLNNVRYIPDMGRNLISYGQLESSGCNYEGGGFEVRFFEGGTRVLTGKYHQGLYYLLGSVRSAQVNTAKASTNVTRLWHTRLAHMNVRSMEEARLSQEC